MLISFPIPVNRVPRRSGATIRRVAIALTLSLGTSLGLHAQPKPVFTANTQVGNVRFWNLLPPGSSPLEVEVSGPDVPKTVALPQARPGDISGSNYWQFSPGTVRLELWQTTPERSSVAAVNQRIGVGDYVTIIAQSDPKDGKPTLRVVDDKYDFKPDAPCALTFFCFVPDLPATYSVNGSKPAKIAPDGMTFVPLPPNTSGIVTITAETKPGVTAAFEVPLTFEDCKSLAIILAADRYGRVRPRPFVRGYVNERPEMAPE